VEVGKNVSEEVYHSTAKYKQGANTNGTYCNNNNNNNNNNYYYYYWRGVDGRIMLGWIFKKWDVGVRTGLGWLRRGIGGGRL
jgi:hypothetical protein